MYELAGTGSQEPMDCLFPWLVGPLNLHSRHYTIILYFGRQPYPIHPIHLTRIPFEQRAENTFQIYDNRPDAAAAPSFPPTVE